MHPSGTVVKNLFSNVGDMSSIPGREDPPEKGKATHSSILAWRISWTEEPGGLQSMGSQSDMTAIEHAYGLQGNLTIKLNKHL